MTYLISADTLFGSPFCESSVGLAIMCLFISPDMLSAVLAAASTARSNGTDTAFEL